jgi:hypothetical protein
MQVSEGAETSCIARSLHQRHGVAVYFSAKLISNDEKLRTYA